MTLTICSQLLYKIQNLGERLEEHYFSFYFIPVFTSLGPTCRLRQRLSCLIETKRKSILLFEYCHSEPSLSNSSWPAKFPNLPLSCPDKFILRNLAFHSSVNLQLHLKLFFFFSHLIT